MSIGERVKHLREKKNLNQVQLAKMLNISNATLSQYESGKRTPSDEIKIHLADIFNVSLDYLLCRTSIITSAVRENPDTEYKKIIQTIESLSPEGKEKAEEYIEMLKTMDEIKKQKISGSNKTDKR